ncbi:DUF29 domain-containing protein [Azospirillum sp. SYSU D00513]|nr:DUF29 domain-containing protein [Azospirillum sp. SYSU D00513]
MAALGKYGEAEAAKAVPAGCPYTVEQLLDLDCWPEDGAPRRPA